MSRSFFMTPLFFFGHLIVAQQGEFLGYGVVLFLQREQLFALFFHNGGGGKFQNSERANDNRFFFLHMVIFALSVRKYDDVTRW